MSKATKKRLRGRPLRWLQHAAKNLVASDSGRSIAGYSIDAAYKVMAKTPGQPGVVDLEDGGYAVPLERKTKIEPPSKTVPISARVPGGVVLLLPGTYGWRIVGRG